MKLISNYKDYYDFLQGIYGIDDKIIYDRTCKTASSPYTGKPKEWLKTGIFKPTYKSIEDYDKVEFFILAICGTIYYVAIFHSRFYFGKDAETINFDSCIDRASKDVNIGIVNTMFNSRVPEYGEVYKFHLTKTDVNERENCPVILVEKEYRTGNFVAKILNPKLSDFGVGQIIPAHDIFIMIGNFLSREKKIEDKRTDVEKIVTHGFDKKTSFRNVK